MKIRTPNIIWILFLLLWCTNSCTQGDKVSKENRRQLLLEADTFLKKEAEAEDFSGTIAISHNSELLFESAYGMADRTWDLPMETGYRFDIASVNKSMISGLVMIAEQEGRLHTHDLLVNYLESYEYEGTFHPQITIHQLLTHTSGLPDYGAVPEFLSADNFRELKRMHVTNPEYVDFISRLTPVGEPGEKFFYSNFAYHLLCILLEDIYDMPFGELLANKIAGPLGMSLTFSTTQNEEIHENVVTGYMYRNDEWEKNPFIDLTLGRRVFSTSGDLVRWGEALSDTTLFTESSLAKIKTNHLEGITDRFSYGYGWAIHNQETDVEMGRLSIDRPYIIHGGSTDGYKSMLVNIDSGSWVIALLANSGNRTDEMRLIRKIVEILNPQLTENQ
ncbi:MAG: serine hydrolase domain-containing protein [Balneolaceae bacterium]|nr:serine hydrolase domain-containing protein [Balneolaceae bacterium]